MHGLLLYGRTSNVKVREEAAYCNIVYICR